MQITKELLQKIFALSKLTLNESKADKMISDMEEILSFISVLNEIDTENVEETSQVNGLQNILRNDEVKLCQTEKYLLACTPHKIINQSVCVPNVL